VTRRPQTTAAVLRRLRHTLAEVEQERMRPEAAVRARAQHLLHSIATIPAAILVANNRGHYVEANQRAVRLTGYTRAELLRRSVWDLTPASRAGLARRLWREFLDRGQMDGVYQIRRKDGRLRRTRYVAIAGVLPGVHLSALVPYRTPPRRRPLRATSK
jgi:PAS domain S-box-containing protein